MSSKQTPARPGNVKATVDNQFSPVAANYRTSTVHATGPELTEIIHMVVDSHARTVLDAGCGPGHTALAIAPSVERVVAVDLSEAMLEQGRLLAQERGITNVEFRQADVEDLPFDDGTFDVVTSRYSAHHWPSPQLALGEFHRVLRTMNDAPGQVILADTVSVDNFVLDTHLQAVELLRDPSHVRDHTPDEWVQLLAAAGFVTEIVFRWELPLNFDAWVRRIATPPASVNMIRTLLANAPEEVRTGLAVQPDASFSLRCALFQATKIIE